MGAFGVARVRAVIVSVNYADFLKNTLSAWRKFLPAGTLTVVTAKHDADTIAVAKRYRVPVYVTDAWTRTDAPFHATTRVMFNKALALDEALGLIGGQPPAVGELCVTLDADVVPGGAWPSEDTFEPGVLYGVRRYKCNNHQELIAHRSGKKSLFVPERDMRNKHPSGYCEMFRYAPGLRFGSYPSAGYYDRDFGERFDTWAMRTDFYVVHLGRKGGFNNWRRRNVRLWDTRPPVPEKDK